MPVDPEFVLSDVAESFLLALAGDVPHPEMCPDPDGDVSFDWISSKDRRVSVSVGTADRLPYAWIDGQSQGHGVEYFDGKQVPARILDEIRRIVGEPKSLEELSIETASRVVEIAKLFRPGVKVTCLVRDPSISYGASDVLVSDDQFSEIVAAVRRYEDRAIKINLVPASE